MAKFFMEDGSTISGDHLMDILNSQNNSLNKPSSHNTYHEIEKMKIPNGKLNRHRILNTNTYDLLTHIQQSLSLNNRCILELITNETHRCPIMNDTIKRRIQQFANNYIDDEFRKNYPRQRKFIKDEKREGHYIVRPETDEEWFERLCHIMMHQNHPFKLQMIKCEECIQSWLNSSTW